VPGVILPGYPIDSKKFRRQYGFKKYCLKIAFTNGTDSETGPKEFEVFFLLIVF
jgi:hypothetical protein